MNKLYLDKSNACIAGVCAGMANWLGIDKTIIRIAAILLLIFGSCGFWIYLLFWILTPAKYE
jgi:phage shock protein PspC (stress-responsive transcriptional regulator)